MGRIWAVAKSVLIEFVRLRSLLAFVLLVLGSCTAGLAVWLHLGAGRGDEKIQTFLSYSLGFSMAILSLLTIFLSVGTVTRDIKRREIFLVAVKPVSRGEFLAGKFAGVALLDLLLLGAVGAAVYGGARVMQRTEPVTEDERSRVRELVLIARRSVEPVLVGVSEQDLQEEVRREAERLIEEETGRLENPTGQELAVMRRTITETVYNQMALQRRAVLPGRHVTWHFTGIRPSAAAGGRVYVRYKQNASPPVGDLAVMGLWHYGDDPAVPFTKPPLVRVEEAGAVHEFAVPVGELSPAGELYVAYQNAAENYPITMVFPLPKEGEVSIEALYVAGGFEANLLRGLGAIYLRLAFLALLGTTMGAWLSLPVAVLLVLVVFGLGISSQFIDDALKWQGVQATTAFNRTIMALVPRLAAYDPAPALEKGRYVAFGMLARAFGVMVVLQGGLAGLAGYAIFRFRELARVTV